jgi:hypothetical protein
MTPANYNLPDAYRGDSYGPINLKVKDQAGNYINFNNARIVELHVKNRKNYAIVLRWSLSNNTVLVDGETISLLVVDGEKMKMPKGIYDYDLQVVDQSSSRTYLCGTLSVSGDVTDIIDYTPTPTATPTPTGTVEQACDFGIFSAHILCSYISPTNCARSRVGRTRRRPNISLSIAQKAAIKLTRQSLYRLAKLANCVPMVAHQLLLFMGWSPPSCRA